MHRDVVFDVWYNTPCCMI